MSIILLLWNVSKGTNFRVYFIAQGNNTSLVEPLPLNSVLTFFISQPTSNESLAQMQSGVQSHLLNDSLAQMQPGARPHRSAAVAHLAPGAADPGGSLQEDQ